MVRFLHTADWQLGMGRRFLGADDALPRYQQARIDAIRRIGGVAADEDVAFVVVAGDVFDSNHPDPRTIERACEALRSIAVPTYLLPGNHDPLNGASVYRSRTFTRRVPDHVVVLADDAPLSVPGVPAEVVGAPWRSSSPTHDLAGAAVADLFVAPPGTVRVLVAHGAVDAGVALERGSRSTIAAASLQAAIDDGRIDYVALGDRHSTWSIPDHDHMWYAGTPEPTRFTEDDPGNVLVVDVAPGGTPQVRPVAVGAWRFEQCEVELRDRASVDRLEDWLSSFEDRARTVVRLKLTGVLSLATRARLDQVLTHHGHALAGLDVPAAHAGLLLEPDDADLEALDLRGYARSALDELRASDEPVATEALAQLFRIALDDHRVA